MTIFEFKSKWTKEDGCCCIDKNSLPCILVSEAIYEIYAVLGPHPGQIYCFWPPYDKYFRKTAEVYYGYKITKENENLVFYTDVETDDGLDNYLRSDRTLDIAFWVTRKNKKRYLIIIHLDYFGKAFGVVIYRDKITAIRISEDDGNFWGEHEISMNELTPWDLGIISSILGDAIPIYSEREKLLENLFNLSRNYGK